METKKLGQSDVDVPVIGMGTWNIAPPDKYAPSEIDDAQIVKALRYGIEKDLTHIDAAEMYGNGRAEELIGRAIKGIPRDSVFIATKVEPQHYNYEDVFRAAKGSLNRLGTEYIDLYQLHWPVTAIAIDNTMRAMEDLADQGIIRFIGVSNFYVNQVEEAQRALSRHRIAANQVKYNVISRGVENDLLTFAEKERITITAYIPLATGYLFTHTGKGKDIVARLAEKYGKTPAQIYLNWLIAKKQVITIPKAVQIKHLEENAAASGWRMDTQDYEEISNSF